MSPSSRTSHAMIPQGSCTSCVACTPAQRAALLSVPEGLAGGAGVRVGGCKRGGRRCRAYPDLRDKKQFWTRKPGCVKANMLLLAHLDRRPIAHTLHKDWCAPLSQWGFPQPLRSTHSLASWKLPTPPLCHAPAAADTRPLQRSLHVQLPAGVAQSHRLTADANSAPW